MDENKGTGERLPILIEARGMVVLGSSNPVGMSRDEFMTSPDLLFHGSREPFVFVRGHDYTKESGLHSQTVCEGFYTTPKESDASLYSIAFGAEKPVVTVFLPYQARMYDFRQVGDVKANANVPKVLFDNYCAYYDSIFTNRWREYNPEDDANYINSHPPRNVKITSEKNYSFEDYFRKESDLDDIERGERASRLFEHTRAVLYQITLRKLSAKEGCDLRQMLSITGNANMSEYAGRTFRNFMLQEGYDGVIYIEGGDHPDHRLSNPASVVFFNLEKIGTYETWNDEN